VPLLCRVCDIIDVPLVSILTLHFKFQNKNGCKSRSASASTLMILMPMCLETFFVLYGAGEPARRRCPVFGGVVPIACPHQHEVWAVLVDADMDSCFSFNTGGFSCRPKADLDRVDVPMDRPAPMRITLLKFGSIQTSEYLNSLAFLILCCVSPCGSQNCALFQVQNRNVQEPEEFGTVSQQILFFCPYT
jgi:hypothetical protein